MSPALSFSNFVELFSLYNMQRAKTFHGTASRIERICISLQMTTDNLENVNAPGKRIGDRAEAIGRKWFTVVVLAAEAFSVRTRVDRFAPFSFVMSRIRSVVNEPIQQGTQTNLRDARNGEDRTEFTLCDRVVDVRQNVCFVERALFEILLHQLIVRFGDELNQSFASLIDEVATFHGISISFAWPSAPSS